MTNTITVVGGLIVGIIGLILWWIWRVDFGTVFRGCFGVTLFFGGALALAIGISEMRASKEFDSAIPAPEVSPTDAEKPAEQSAETDSSGESESAEPEGASDSGEETSS
ncbi:MAG: hypothetical protein AUJ92_08795 [Armatimonadetes bacterium CG2_30_59_28]|nr:hypothetical protein [Armatimonadota bacterium]OIO94981.1 MAG: hypothetical protein AUJ92_08795 [Armatimonadetes bacterium CG2_30_59_28]PIU66775.1 MAG: hypothetical protein COS85_03385 [Armatimonadetes bacterium CG07_land_8_20_14_0_80_59_28]PIX39068.1 MAG: hypothetical protein COZ56_18690 [Armatimonadetes bacterium CG_4_8_14_3_um_filter_58_9]PJB69076.1 MAG: hypothetical protein CO095_10385 [Armatimonadetes bacterium CG_4_9_14_3_um_filter_58_7]